MGAKKKIQQLKRKLNKQRAKHILAISDLQIELRDKELRMNLAESRARFLSEELALLKFKNTISVKIEKQEEQEKPTGEMAVFEEAVN